jgi:hypothetical protein
VSVVLFILSSSKTRNMSNEDIFLAKPDLRSRPKVLQGADCRRTGSTLRRLKLDEERKHHYQYLIEYYLDEVRDELCNRVHLSVNKKKRWEAVEELQEQCTDNDGEDESTDERPAVVTTIHHFKKPTNRWTCEKIKNRYFKSNTGNNQQENTTEIQATNGHGSRTAKQRRKLRMGRKGFVGAERPQEATEEKEVIPKATVLYEVLQLPKAGAYPLNRRICHCHFCTSPRSNKGKKKQSIRARDLELYA